MLSELARDVAFVARPLSAATFQLGTRMTVLRLADGTVALHSAVKVDDEEKAAIDTLGPVSAIIVPNTGHTLFVAEAASRWPEARLVGPAGVRRRVPGDRWSDAPLPGLVEHAFGGAEKYGEKVYFHEASGTLVVTDILFYYPQSPGGWTGWYLGWQGVVGRVGQTIICRSLIRDKVAAKRSVAELRAYGPRRIALAHGGVFEGDVDAALQDAFAWLG
jgi:hypothetical protein